MVIWNEDLMIFMRLCMLAGPVVILHWYIFYKVLRMCYLDTTSYKHINLPSHDRGHYGFIFRGHELSCIGSKLHVIPFNLVDTSVSFVWRATWKMKYRRPLYPLPTTTINEWNTKMVVNLLSSHLHTLLCMNWGISVTACNMAWYFN